MAEVTSDMVQKLRSLTGAGMMNCKRALGEAAGDMEKAVKILREQGSATAAKRAGRTTAEGLVTSRVNGKTAVLLELNCETDFVARTAEFQGLLQEMAQKAAEAAPAWNTAEQAPTGRIQEAAGKLGENIALGRFTRFDRQGPGLFFSYIHPSGGVGKVGVLLELGFEAEKPEAIASEDIQTLGKDLAMQVAATNPRWVKKEDVPADILEQEKAIAVEQAKRENKPEKIWDKISQGKLTQFYAQFCLLQQPFVKDPGGKTAVQAVVEQAAKKAGVGLTVRRFKRYKVGEEEQ